MQDGTYYAKNHNHPLQLQEHDQRLFLRKGNGEENGFTTKLCQSEQHLSMHKGILTELGRFVLDMTTKTEIERVFYFARRNRWILTE